MTFRETVFSSKVDFFDVCGEFNKVLTDLSPQFLSGYHFFDVCEANPIFWSGNEVENMTLGTVQHIQIEECRIDVTPNVTSSVTPM